MFSTWLQDTRHKLNLTQQQLANALAVTPSAVGMWEQGRRLPSARAAARLRAFFTAQGYPPPPTPWRQGPPQQTTFRQEVANAARSTPPSIER